MKSTNKSTIMTKLEAIKQTGQKLSQVKEEILLLDKKGWFSKLFRHKGLLKKLKRYEHSLNDQIDEYLRENNAEYRDIIFANYDLLKTSNIHFTVYSEDVSFTGNRSEAIEGDIHPNGYSYCQSTETNFSGGGISNYSYPNRFEGYVDFWGCIKLKSTDIKYGFFNTFPVKYEGQIDENGFIRIEVTETRTEWNKSTTIGKLIANHFEYDEDKNIAFQDNLNKLRLMIANFKESLTL